MTAAFPDRPGLVRSKLGKAECKTGESKTRIPFKDLTTVVANSTSRGRWNSDDDERYAGYQIFGADAERMVSDAELTDHLRNVVGLEGQPGTPDCTIFPADASIHDSTWRHCRMVQVCRAYSRAHLHAMIGEKIYKSQVFLNSLVWVRKTKAEDLSSYR